MYRILEVIKVTKLYDLEKCKPSINDINLMMEFLERKEIDGLKLISFLRHHTNCVFDMIRFIPTQMLLNAYLDYNFLLNYMSQELYDYILKKMIERFRIRLYLEQDYLSDLVQLNNYYNNIYNFCDPFILRKLNQLRTKLDIIEWDNYFIGSDVLLRLASRKPVTVITLYPKSKAIKFKPGNYFRDQDGNYICIHEGFVIMIGKKYFKNLGEVLIEKDTIVCDKDGIYCTLETYQKLGDIYESKNNINVTDLTPLIGLSGFFKSYKYNKLIIPHCYVCKKYYDNELTYDKYIDMCLDCGKFNYDKRVKMANMNGCVAFVTGIRQKIGLQIALKLLRCGAKVIGTTRFVNATYYNYAKQPDFDQWKDNLIICRCDFLDLSSVMKLIEFLKTQNVNIFINNACQTIRASQYYYQQINLLERIIHESMADHLIQYDNNSNNSIVIHDNKDRQIMLYKCTSNENLSLINHKIHKYDIKFNQFNDIKDKDIKDQSSWNQNISNIAPGEILEAIAINQTVPTLLINQLKDFMKKPRFIIQVTALEGQFSTNKLSTHAHTNMCKAAMNMLIKTISEENEPDQYVYSINPSFVSGVNPQQDHYPLGDDDGATRIVYPLIEFYNGTPLPKEWIHLRNYLPEKW